jgi:hypothetical protein
VVEERDVIRVERSFYGFLVWVPGDGRVFRFVSRYAYTLGLISGGVAGFNHREKGNFQGMYLDWKPRPYVLGKEREAWGWLFCKPFHRLKRGHWPGPLLTLFGPTCGTCVPWPCCGATGWRHTDDCAEYPALLAMP